MWSLFILSFVGLLSIGLGGPMTRLEAEQWNHFKKQYGKAYHSLAEENYRQGLFLRHLHTIEEHNKLFENGQVTFEMEINKFADLSNEEFRKLKNGYKMRTEHSGAAVYTAAEYENIPDSVDWRTKGAITEVKDQGGCGDCWAFSATGSLEGQWFLKTGNLVSLSEQNLIDCSWDEGNEGCVGGLMNNSFQYVMRNGGIDTEESYPYEFTDKLCRFTKDGIGATVVNYTEILPQNETTLKAAVANIGPISAAVDAGKDSYRFYKSGIYYEGACSSVNLDHGILVVGYGNETAGEYWIVKDSHGSDWGENGYIRMARNKNNNCGIATSAIYPNV